MKITKKNYKIKTTGQPKKNFKNENDVEGKYFNFLYSGPHTTCEENEASDWFGPSPKMPCL